MSEIYDKTLGKARFRVIKTTAWAVEVYQTGDLVFTSQPKASPEAAVEYAERLITRYAENAGKVLVEHLKNIKGGPYRYVLPKGEWPIDRIGAIDEPSLKAAKNLLCAWLGRKRLPKGTKVIRIEDEKANH